MQVLDFLVISLATWRLCNLVVYEEGPFGGLTRIRELTGIIHSDTGEQISWPDWNPLHCIFCTSLYMAPVALGLWQFAPLIAAMLAVSAMTCLIHLFNLREI